MANKVDCLAPFLICEKLTKVLAPLVSLPVTSLDEEEEGGLELGYADGPPTPCAEGAAQGKGVSPSQFSES